MTSALSRSIILINLIYRYMREIAMARKKKTLEGKCCAPDAKESCRVDSIISVDERGQTVLPKELRERAGIRPGDKLAVASWEKDGKVCCITLIKVEDLVDIIKDRLGPIMKEML